MTNIEAEIVTNAGFFSSMLHAFLHLATEHDAWIVGLAVAICLIASAATIGLFYRASESEGRARLLWLALDAVAGGCGIWATHFIAMLAYHTEADISFDLPLTLLSLLLAIVITGAGLWLALQKPVVQMSLAGGALVGIGTVVMHYTGMAALRISGYLVWDFRLVAMSILFGAGLSALAFRAATAQRGWGPFFTASLLLALSIVALHFTGMAAASFVHNPALHVSGSLSRDAMSITVAAAAIIIIGMSLVAAFSDRRARSQLRRQKLLLDTALANMGHGLCMFDRDGRIALYNDRYLEMFNLSPSMLDGKTLLDLFQTLKSTGNFEHHPEETFANVVQSMQAGRTGIRTVTTTDGRAIRVTDQPMTDGGWVATFEDITEWQKDQARISHMAQHDGLTDLPNRRLFREQLGLALRRTARGEMVAVHCIDLDRFKYVNDTLGHPVGDDLLRQVAARLQSAVRATDTVARLGGDEFAVVQADSNLQAAEAAALAGRIVEVLSAPYDVKGHQVVIGASVGIAVGPDDGNDPDEILRNADMALYRAKADGRGAYRFFEAGMDARAQVRRVLELDLRAALLHNEFELWYQPILDLKTGHIISFEALIRWKHPQRGIVVPDHFIRLAEETGLIVPIGEWVLRRACSDAAGWSEDVSVAVNLSPAQFRNRNLVTSIVEALGDFGLPPERLELEITEAALLQDNEQTMSMLHELRDHGVRISIDDFGAGYSSLGYLRSFPFDKIKIDRTFVHDLSSRGDCMAIVRAVAGLGKSLGISTTAEGVETSEQLSLLRAEGCSQVQGYLFNPPRPAAEVERMLAAAKQRRSA